MAEQQLQLVADWEREKERKCAQDFQIAQQHAQMNKQKLESLEQYRLDYLRQTQQKATSGLEAQSFNQHLSFVGKLDKACEEQTKIHSQAMLVADQRKRLWLQQQRKRKAVEMLLDKKHQQKIIRENRLEQQALDEIALQKFVRK